MKATIKLISRYEATLVDVIRWLDENKHSNTYIRDTVDRMLNHEKDLKGDSTKLRELGWTADYTFETMIDEMIEYWMNEL